MTKKTRIFLVEITQHETGWKGSWYRTGQRHFVQQNRHWPMVSGTRWHALTPRTWGGISAENCRVLRGPIAWLRCLWFRLAERNASWQ